MAQSWLLMSNIWSHMANTQAAYIIMQCDCHFLSTLWYPITIVKASHWQMICYDNDQVCSNAKKPFSIKPIILGVCGRNSWDVSNLKTRNRQLYCYLWHSISSLSWVWVSDFSLLLPPFSLLNDCGLIWIFFNHSSKFECFNLHQAWNKLIFTYARVSFLWGIFICHSKT